MAVESHISGLSQPMNKRINMKIPSLKTLTEMLKKNRIRFKSHVHTPTRALCGELGFDLKTIIVCKDCGVFLRLETEEDFDNRENL